MTAIFSKITTKSQTTVPKQVRAALGVKPGDLLVYRIARGGKVTLAKGEPLDRAYLKAVESTMSEWASAADKAAYDDL
jgi:antitoxin PrlF